MLRRLPTALTISPEDIQSYEEALNRRVAFAHYNKTGEDPEGLFTSAETTSEQRGRDEREENKAVDPNDELKPLPGDKARIVRGREERILGVPGAGAGAGTGRRG